MCIKSQLHCPQKFLFQAVYHNSFLMVFFFNLPGKACSHFCFYWKSRSVFFFFLTEDRSDLVHWCDKRD